MSGIVEQVLNERKQEVECKLRGVSAELARFEAAVTTNLRWRDSLVKQLAEIETALKETA